MRFATWNLDSLHPLTPARETSFRQAISEVRADVWVLTETWEDWQPADGYTPVAESSSDAVDLKAWPNRRWVAIWARPGLSTKSLCVRGQPDRMACGRVELPNGRGIVFVGTVLPWPLDALWPNVTGYCQALARQVTDWDELWGANRADVFVVAGDFNQSLPLRQYFGYEQNVNALNTAMENYGLVCLTPGVDPHCARHEHCMRPMIDHICVSKKDVSAVAPKPGYWPIPYVDSAFAATDHAGVFIDLDL